MEEQKVTIFFKDTNKERHPELRSSRSVQVQSLDDEGGQHQWSLL